jgi:hypothetical protein
MSIASKNSVHVRMNSISSLPWKHDSRCKSEFTANSLRRLDGSILCKQQDPNISLRSLSSRDVSKLREWLNLILVMLRRLTDYTCLTCRIEFTIVGISVNTVLARLLGDHSMPKQWIEACNGLFM